MNHVGCDHIYHRPDPRRTGVHRGRVRGAILSGKIGKALTKRKRLACMAQLAALAESRQETDRRRMAYKQSLAELQEAKELHAAAVLRHIIGSEMQADR